MNPVHTGAFDLNLLTTFEALWSERNVTRAARRVGVTQSALSHALARLRQQLDDPLFRPSPGGMVPTARAKELAEPLGMAFELLRAAVGTRPVFDPRRLRRAFTLTTADYGELVILPRLLARVAKRAPEVTLIVHPAGDARELSSGAHDLVLAPALHSDFPSLRMQPLFEDRFVCLLRRRHPDAKKPLTLDRFTRLSHVLVSPTGAGDGPVDVALRALGRERRVAVRVPHFLVAPLAIAESDYIITLPERLVLALAPLERFCVLRPPLALPPVSVNQFWHERNDDDPAHRWFRELVAEVSQAGPRSKQDQPASDPKLTCDRRRIRVR